ncbi:hypothetical protein LCI18_014401 [Fusarium solani-melongenae]|uniref:Uncharacterized protein n=1 Tax=Fusarium solani subsp. cucurbitae TaxID=2747967 RepID=A0ACD3ZQI7_FUSSC|nr:hypothetical protein LCI18_014401 [Fusarium solani-melongenae]
MHLVVGMMDELGSNLALQQRPTTAPKQTSVGNSRMKHQKAPVACSDRREVVLET